MIANDAEPGVPKSSATGTRTRVARVRAEYPNQLDYSGICIYHIPLRGSSDRLLDRQTDRQTDCAWPNSWQALSLGERFFCKMEDCERGRGSLAKWKIARGVETMQQPRHLVQPLQLFNRKLKEVTPAQSFRFQIRAASSVLRPRSWAERLLNIVNCLKDLLLNVKTIDNC